MFISKKLLIISGPTATGKTSLAVKLAEKFNGEIISADSRQIYKGMDIGTGKDHPQGFKINLIDLIDPDQSFSVAQYRQLALEKINQIYSRKKLPIFVGGTGQYIDAIINPRSTFDIKPNRWLRFVLNKLPLSILQKIYSLLDQKSFNDLNNSEKHNPHRLIRKIEIKFSDIFSTPVKSIKTTENKFDLLHLSLTAPNDYLYHRVDLRVQKRLDEGLFAEITRLSKKYSWSSPGLNTFAYKEFSSGFTEENIKRWRFDEHAYVRRQKTWFKKSRPSHFIDITNPSYLKDTFRLVEEWYNSL